MKRNEVNMTVSKVLKEVKRELRVRAKIFPKWIEDKKLAEIVAAERYVALLEVKEIFSLMEKKGLSIQELKNLLHSIQQPEIPTQGKMNFNSKPKNPN